MATKTTIVLITGGNTGIGYAAVEALMRSDRRYHILLAGRDVAKAEAAAEQATKSIDSNGTVEPVQLDVESDESIQKAFDNVAATHDRLDCLINNAGASFDQYIYNGSMTPRQAFAKSWDVNVTGAHMVTDIFAPLLIKSEDPRLLFITSGLSSLEISSDTTHPRYVVPPAGWPKKGGPSSYKAAKAGLNMLMTDWTKVLKNDGVKVWAIAPGFLATNLMGDPETLRKAGAGEASLGGSAIRNVIEGKRDAETGRTVREYDTPVQPW